MTLKEKILEDKNLSIRDNFKKTLLSTVIGELDRTTKTPTDAQVISVVKKIIEANKEVATEDALKENEILNEYMPKQLTKTEIECAIQHWKIVESENGEYSIKDMGKVMNYLASRYPGQYDGKVASQIVKEKLSTI